MMKSSLCSYLASFVTISPTLAASQRPTSIPIAAHSPISSAVSPEEEYTSLTQPQPYTTIYTEISSHFHKRKVVPGDRKHAQYLNHTELRGCDDCLQTGYCGSITDINEFHTKAPSKSDCDAIRLWAQDRKNQGYWHVKMDRLVDIPWVPLITAGYCTVVVGTDYKESLRDGVAVGTKDVADLVQEAVTKHEKDGSVGVSGDWEYCTSPAFRGDGLVQWPAKFQIMVNKQVP
ncbi:hypothetical protein BJ170DRAFT_711541 [Xylariales sp. AK1849]|nr:hypothetical protein BJ170DRAFT_711541 [Xylariales sp. AK1849]